MSGVGDLWTYNIASGGLEAIIHGMANGILRQEDYNNICQCDSLEDMKLHLAGTDYGQFLQNEATLSSKVITERALDRLVNDFKWLRANAPWPLSEFLDYITYEYMIANVLKLISGARSGKGTLELLQRTHPLGQFEGIGALTAAQNIDDLYDLVLADSPIGKFFQRTERTDFDEFSMEYIRSILQKNYLEHFYAFCEKIGGETWEVMKTLLEFEADRFVLTLTRNTYGVKELQKDERMKLFPNVGQLVTIHEDLSNIDDDDALKEKLRPYSDLFKLVEDLSIDDPSNSLENKFMLKSAQLHKDSLARQFQYGSFFSVIKLRELEVNNLMWIAECIIQNHRHRIHEYTAIFEGHH